MLTIVIVCIVLLTTTRCLRTWKHNRHIRHRLELMTLNVVRFNCRKGCGNRARTACGACFECCGRCRSKQASDPAVQRDPRMEQERKES